MRTLFFISLILSSFAFGQTGQNNQNGQNTTPTTPEPEDSVQLVQLTGVVITDSLYRMPFTRIADLTTRKGTISDYYGYFALVVHPGDTIQFSYLGYKKKQYIVPDTTTLTEISLVQLMTEDTLMKDPVEVYPWPSKEEFADAFVNMDLPDDDLKRAQKRLSPQEMAFVGALMDADATNAYSAYRVNQYQEFYTRGQGPQNNLLNPSAWADFLQGIGTGRYQISP